MQSPLQVVFHDLERSDAIEEAVRKHAAELDTHFDRITSCRVVVGAPHRSQHRGRIYSVRIDIGVPRKEIIVNKDHGDDQSHEDVYVAINHAFKAARRQLDEYARKIRGNH
jgi:ribosomal subunit interface protein